MIDSYVEWLREHVGRRKVYLPFATVILRDDKNRVLLQRRTDFEFWGLPGGVLEMDEDIETAARRELLEETGLTAGPLRLVGIYTDPKYDVQYPNGDQVQQFTFCLEGQRSGGLMNPDGLETTEQHFAVVDDLSHFDLPLWYRDMLFEAAQNRAPAFRPPAANDATADQIAAVRPYVGTQRFSGVGASVVIEREDGKMLMLQHVDEEHWRIPSGFSDLGENAAQTAVREVWEELCLHIEPVRLIGVHATTQLNSTYANGDRIRNVGVIFDARLKGGALELDQNEIREMAWMTPQEVLSSVHPSRITLYKDILRHREAGCFIS